jgi:hypothetical protein
MIALANESAASSPDTPGLGTGARDGVRGASPLAEACATCGMRHLTWERPSMPKVNSYCCGFRTPQEHYVGSYEEVIACTARGHR